MHLLRDRRCRVARGRSLRRPALQQRRTGEASTEIDPRELLAQADEKLSEDDYAEARRLFLEVAKKWPKEKIAADAHFGLGETYFRERKCKEALFEYGKVMQQFPTSKPAPNAYLRSSECFTRLQMFPEAKLALEEVVKEYPDSAAATEAKAKLKDAPSSGKRR